MGSPHGKVVPQSRGEVAALSQLTHQNPNQFLIDQGNLMARTVTIDQGNLMACLKIRIKSLFVKLRRRILTSIFQGYQHSTVKQLHGASVRELIQKIENHPRRQALQRDLQNQQFNPFRKESKELIHEVGWESNCVNYSIWNPKRSAKYAYHTGTSASSIARAGSSCETRMRKTRSTSSTPWTSSLFPITTSKWCDPTGTVTERNQGTAHITSQIRSRRDARMC